MKALSRGSFSLRGVARCHVPHSFRATTSGTTVIDFGKHSGMTFDDVYKKHPDYCAWIRKQSPHAKTSAFIEYLQANEMKTSGSSSPSSQANERKTTSGYSSSSSQLRDNHVFRFGKHAGKTFEEVCRSEKQYCQWMLSQSKKPDASEDSKFFARFVEERFPELVDVPTLASEPSKEASSKRGASQWAKDSSFRQSKPFAKATPTSKTQPDSVSYEASRSEIKRSTSNTSPTAGTELTVESGSRLLNWGNKYASSTYAEIFDKDQNYCRWVVKTSLQEPSLMKVKYPQEVWPFIAYVQHRWLLGGHVAPPVVKVTAQRGCLEACSFVITGVPAEMNRQTLEELVSFFGGVVRSAISSKTTCLLVGATGQHGEAIESSSKYRKALQQDVAILTVRQLLEDLAETAGDNDPVTFSSEAVQNKESVGVERL